LDSGSSQQRERGKTSIEESDLPLYDEGKERNLRGMLAAIMSKLIFLAKEGLMMEEERITGGKRSGRRIF